MSVWLSLIESVEGGVNVSFKKYSAEKVGIAITTLTSKQTKKHVMTNMHFMRLKQKHKSGLKFLLNCK